MEIALLAALFSGLTAAQDHKELEKALRDRFQLDLTAAELEAPPISGDDPFETLYKALRKMPSTSSGSGSSSGGRHPVRNIWAEFRDGTAFALTLKHDAELKRLELDLVYGGRRLRVTHHPRESLTVAVEDEARDLWATYVWRRGKSSRLLWTEKSDAYSKVWPASKDPFRADPAELEKKLLRPLRAFPVSLCLTPADPDVADVCLRWGDVPTVDEALKRLREQIEDNDPQVRADALSELKRRVAKEPALLRWVVVTIDKTQDAEVVANLREVLASQKTMVTAFKLVSSEKLYRDLPYLGAFLGHPDAALSELARRRLENLARKTFADRAEFEAWMETHRDKLTWDEAAGRYR